MTQLNPDTFTESEINDLINNQTSDLTKAKAQEISVITSLIL